MSQYIVQVCHGRSCIERFSPCIRKRLDGDVVFYSYPEEIVIENCLCQNRCKEGPVVSFEKDIHVGVNPIKASEILKKKVQEWKNQQQKEE